jgi:hypothetical protein
VTALPTSLPAGHEPSADELTALLPIFAYKLFDETVNNTATLQNDDELLATVKASATYEVFCHVFFNSGTSPDIKFGWTGPSGATLDWTSVDPFNTSWAKKSISGSIAIGTSGANESALLIGVLIVSTTAGTLQLQWAQNGAIASDTSVLAGSYLRLRRVA